MLFAIAGAAVETAFSGAYNVAQFFGWEWGKHRRPREAPRFALGWVALLLLGLLIVQTGIDPVMLTEYAVIFSVVALPLTYIPILIIANDADYMGSLVNGRATNVVGCVFLVVIAVVSITAVPLMIITGSGTA
jgi:Mn2+/Fe2+ NRAMP family transporter